MGPRARGHGGADEARPRDARDGSPPPPREGRAEIRPPRGRVRREDHSPPKVRGPWRPQNLGGASRSGLRGSPGWGFLAGGGRRANGSPSPTAVLRVCA